MKTIVKALVFLVVLVVIAFAGLAVFVGTMNADKYRQQLVELLTKKTGRTVKLDGPIAFSLGLSGVRVSIQDASISNPSWASRPTLAGMGTFELGIGIMPLLEDKLVINELLIENADILVETNAQGQHNWDFGTAVASADSAAASAPSVAKTSAPMGASLSVNSLTITNSQLALRGVDGKISKINLASLQLGRGLTGAELTVRGDVNGAPITANVKTSIVDLLSTGPFMFDADATYDIFRLTARGKTDIHSGTADLLAYSVAAGATVITGALDATWNGARPTLRGTLNSDHINPADFKSGIITTEKNGGVPAPEPQKAQANKRMFNNNPLPLSALKAVDAELNVSVGAFPVGLDSLQKITAKLTLVGGNLILAPVKANVGTSPVDVQVKLNAAQSPARLTVGVIGNGIDLGDLQKLGGMTPFMTGKAGANIQLAAAGDTAHELASSLGGVISVTAEKGRILTGAAASVSSLLAAVFSTAGGDDALNCLAARFIAKGGVVNDNGLLIDSAASTVSGNGALNLGAETVNMTLHARTKLINIGGLVPSLQIGGTLTNPDYSVDASSVVKNVVGNLTSGNIDVVGNDVPEIQADPSGQNACVYTLNHPRKASSSSILPSNSIDAASKRIQNIGGSVLKGLFGK